MSSKSKPVAVIGLGYVGLPLVLELVRSGHEVVGIDLNASRIAQLIDGRSYVDDISNEQIAHALSTRCAKFTTDFSLLRDCQAISICVPTPLRQSRDPDTSCIESAMEQVLHHIAPGTLVALESTTYPGTTRDLVAQPLQKKGFVIGKDVYVAFSPERVDPGNAKFNTRNTPKIVAGITASCLERAVDLYKSVADTIVTLETPEEAELSKLLENTFRAVNIALINEFAMLSDRMNINIWNVIKGASTKPFGFMPFHPGPGIGGHCIPLDPVYLGWKARSFDFYSRFIETATDINANMPRFVLQKLAKTANAHGILLKGAKVVVGGIAYKPNVKDARESPAIELIKLLCHEALAAVYYVDPLAHVDHEIGLPDGVKRITQEQAIQLRPDAFVLVTPHANVNWAGVASASRIVFDTRNAMKDQKGHPAWLRL